MIFVRSSCLTWNHNGSKGIKYPSQWKSSLRTFYGCHHHLVYPHVSGSHHWEHSTVVIIIWFTPMSMEVITKNILRLSSPSGLPPCQWKSSLRAFYVVITIWFTPMSVEVITKNILRCHHHLVYPPSQWKSSLRTFYVVITIWFIPMSVEVITKSILRCHHHLVYPHVSGSHH